VVIGAEDDFLGDVAVVTLGRGIVGSVPEPGRLGLEVRGERRARGLGRG
jgi:hypothetical protein